MSLVRGVTAKKNDPSSEIIKPQLTSIIDMMVFLLIFLLKSLSTEGDIITPAADLVLPVSTSKEKVKPALMIEVTQRDLLLDGKRVMTLQQLGQLQALDIPPLFDGLKKISRQWGEDKKQHEVIIQCDKMVDFKDLKKVLNTCARASFNDFSLLVKQKNAL